MILGISILLVLVTMGECLPQGNPCPGYCECKIFAYFHHVNCSGAGLKDLPESLHYNTSTLVFSKNDLRLLRNKTFEYHTRILQLYLDNNKIRFLEVSTFWNMRDLRVLYLDHNVLTEIPTDAFVKNLQLIWLDLSGNNLLIPENGVFLNSPSVTRLFLTDCKLDHVTSDMFVMMLKLEKLDLSNNEIQALPLRTFTPVSSTLSDMNLYGNKLNCNCELVPFYQWAAGKNLMMGNPECSNGLPWVRVSEQDCSAGVFTWVGAGLGVLLSVALVIALAVYACRRRKQSPVQRRRQPLPSLPAGPTGEYIEVVAEKTYESIRQKEVARYMASPTSSVVVQDMADGPVYVNSFVPPSAPKSRRDRVPTYDDVRPASPTAKTAKMDPKARCMSLASILKDCDYYETVD